MTEASFDGHHGRSVAIDADLATHARTRPSGWASLSLVDTGLSSIGHVLDALGYRD